jgi:hypothetical protein
METKTQKMGTKTDGNENTKMGTKTDGNLNTEKINCEI